MAKDTAIVTMEGESIHPFILYQTTKVHRLGIHIKRYKHTAYTQTDKDRHTPNNTDYYNELNNKTHRTIALSQADALLAKLSFELWIKVLKLGSPSSNNIFVTLLYFG